MTWFTLRPPAMCLFTWLVFHIVFVIAPLALLWYVFWLRPCDDDDNYDDYGSALGLLEEGYACLLLPKPLGDSVYCSMAWEACSRRGLGGGGGKKKSSEKENPPQRSLHLSRILCVSLDMGSFQASS